jgi:hypothetical protein
MKWFDFFSRLTAMCLCFFITCYCHAQLTKDDSDFYQSAISKTITAYYQAMGDQSGLYNGVLYPGYLFQFRGESPFFDEGKSDTGWVHYDSILYSGIPLYYDDLSQVVIIDDNGSKIQLNNKRLDEFSIGNHHFIRLAGKAKNSSDFYQGFYELLFSGGTRVLKRTSKNLTDYVSGNETAEKLITRTEHFYIEKDGLIYATESKKDILSIFPDKKNEILQFIKKNKLKFNKNTEHSLLQLAPYYDKIRK